MHIISLYFLFSFSDFEMFLWYRKNIVLNGQKERTETVFMREKNQHSLLHMYLFCLLKLLIPKDCQLLLETLQIKCSSHVLSRHNNFTHRFNLQSLLPVLALSRCFLRKCCFLRMTSVDTDCGKCRKETGLS